jgi:hypothetical protein
MIYFGLLLGPLILIALFFWQYPAQISLTVLAATVLLDCLNLGSQGIPLQVTIYPDDIACATLVAAAVIVSLRCRTILHTFCWPALVLLGLAVLSFGRGALIWGVQPAGNGIRTLIVFVVPAVALGAIGQTFRIDVRLLRGWFCGASLIFAAVALLRWTGALPVPEEIYRDDYRQVVRVLHADYALIFCQTLMAILVTQLEREVRWLWFAAIGCLTVMIVALQHRSVWVAMFLGLLWLAVRSVRVARRRWIQVAFATGLAAVMGVLVLMAFRQFDNVSSLVKANIEETQQEDSTWNWRVEGFDEATGRVFSQGVTEAAIGPPAGWERDSDASAASVHVHNQYLDTLSSYGVIGFIALIVWLWMVARQIRDFGARMRGSRLQPWLFEALFVSEMAFFMAYAGALLSSVTIGLMWAATSRGQRVVESTSKVGPASRRYPRRTMSASPA